MTTILDFPKEDGGHDWAAYDKHQINAGEKCSECGAHILNLNIFGKEKVSGPQRCYDCKQFEKPEECSSETFIRCPECGYKIDVFAREYYEILSDNSHDVSCIDCDHEFEVQTSVSYTFTSPEMIQPQKSPTDES